MNPSDDSLFKKGPELNEITIDFKNCHLSFKWCLIIFLLVVNWLGLWFITDGVRELRKDYSDVYFDRVISLEKRVEELESTPLKPHRHKWFTGEVIPMAQRFKTQGD